MLQLPELPLTIHAGKRFPQIDTRPLPPYSPQVLAFLGDLSRLLLALPEIRQFPDLAGFAYWCRPAHLKQLAAQVNDGHRRLGRGLAFHIAPSNVPINFAFSLVFGLLSGNANIVRIPQTQSPQVAIVCNALEQLFLNPDYARLANMTCIVSYPRNDEITQALSAHCLARVLWGGDQTIVHLRRLATPPRCVEIAFADRYSFCLLNAASMLQLTDHALQCLVDNFYNDAYLLDQNACSSPHLIIWHGEKETIDAAMQIFWGALFPVVHQKYKLAPIHAMDKFVHLCRTAITVPEAAISDRHGNLIYRIRLQSLPANIDACRGSHGTFYEFGTLDLSCLAAIVGEKYQTLTCLGGEEDKLAQWVVEQQLGGIDRVVPIGKALDIDTIWDGYDIVRTLSRIIATT